MPKYLKNIIGIKCDTPALGCAMAANACHSERSEESQLGGMHTRSLGLFSKAITMVVITMFFISSGQTLAQEAKSENEQILPSQKESQANSDNKISEEDESAYLRKLAQQLAGEPEEDENIEETILESSERKTQNRKPESFFKRIIQMFGLSFLACILLGMILGYLGTHVLRREIIFIDISLAQFAAVGATIAHFAVEYHEGHHEHFLAVLAVGVEKIVHLFSQETQHNHELVESILSYACSLICVMIIALFYAFAKKKIVQISLEAIIGVTYAVASAAVLFMYGASATEHVHIQEMLAGNLLWVESYHIKLCLVLFLIIALCFLIFHKPLNRLSDNYRQLSGQGLKGFGWDFLFYTLMGMVVTVAIEIAGVIMVFAYLVIPATIAAMFARRLHWQLLIIAVITTVCSATGLLFSHFFADFSVGPPIGMCLGGMLILAALLKKALICPISSENSLG